MPITQEETKAYAGFIQEQLTALKCGEVTPQEVLWHYTTGEALLSIIQSGTLYATQVSCLNDSTEIRYATELFRDALCDIKTTSACSETEAALLARLITVLSEEPNVSPHLPSWWFVTCLTKEKDDLSQWRAYSGSGDGYAIGFYGSGLFGPALGPVHALVRVNYDAQLHKELAAKVAQATMRFLREGLERRANDSPQDRDMWTSDFLTDWFARIGLFGPVVKDPSFHAENEYRIVHQLQVQELPKLRFKQKQTLMSRHLPLVFQVLPIAEVMLGPTHRHREISRISIQTLLQQQGYSTVPVSFSTIPFQPTT
jgi:hypothetical protein